jgi:hypothetical protein
MTNMRAAMRGTLSALPTTIGGVDATEIFFTTLLVLVSIVIVWFAGYVVYKLFKGQA